MSFSPSLSSAFNDTKNRSPFQSSQSGMCSFCTEDCAGSCELGLSAVLGAQAVYPTNTGGNQVASEKTYPLDYSHFNINGRVFGAIGAAPTFEEAEIYNVGLEREYGLEHTVKLAMPVILPAVVKLNWRDYYAGAAMAGVTCVIGESSSGKDPDARLENGKIVSFPLLGEMLDSFRRYDRGYGQIVLQCNTEDDMQGLPEYAIAHYGLTALEFKFGQSAKGTQPVHLLKGGYPEALQKQESGTLVHPNPNAPGMAEAYEKGLCPNFYSYARLPQWTAAYLQPRIKRLREMGLKNVYFKMAGYDPGDLEQVLRLAAQVGVDMVTFDGAGGGSGYSPCRMMNEWALPTVCMEAEICKIAKRLEAQGLKLPAITVTGGFSMEDQVYKALAFGNGSVLAVGLCRASMAAAMAGKRIGALIGQGKTPERYQAYGTTVEEIFAELPDLRALYGKEANGFPTGAVGVYSYLQRIAMGLRHFGALNRKFDVSCWDRSDLIPLTQDARALLREG